MTFFFLSILFADLIIGSHQGTPLRLFFFDVTRNNTDSGMIVEIESCSRSKFGRRTRTTGKGEERRLVESGRIQFPSQRLHGRASGSGGSPGLTIIFSPPATGSVRPVEPHQARQLRATYTRAGESWKCCCWPAHNPLAVRESVQKSHELVLSVETRMDPPARASMTAWHDGV